MILTILGARPQFIKAAPVSRSLKEIGLAELIVHTGQHFDYNMSGIFWDELELEPPKVNLGVKSGSHAYQTGTMMQRLEQYIFGLNKLPSAILVYGDTNSTLAGALVASKIKGIPLLHIEAGLRSFNMTMPEEINRILTDRVSDLLFCPSKLAVENLRKEGLVKGVEQVGDVMLDAMNMFSIIARNKVDISDIANIKSEFSIFTLHRPINTNNTETIQEILHGLATLNETFIWPMHPRLNQLIKILSIPTNIHVIPPVSYLQMLKLLDNCKKVVTDSGGLQKEAYWKKKQCITIRLETEWIETLAGGWNKLTSTKAEEISEKYNSNIQTAWTPLYGDGSASDKISASIAAFL